MTENDRASIIENAKELTFSPDGKTDEALWDMVAEECRRTTPAWRAYERLRSKYVVMKRRIDG